MQANVREMIKRFRKKWGPEKASNRYLREIFPRGGLQQQGNRLAGLLRIKGEHDSAPRIAISAVKNAGVYWAIIGMLFITVAGLVLKFVVLGKTSAPIQDTGLQPAQRF